MTCANAMRMQKTARKMPRLSQNLQFGKVSWVRSNAGCDCCGASPPCQRLNAIKFALPAVLCLRLDLNVNVLWRFSKISKQRRA